MSHDAREQDSFDVNKAIAAVAYLVEHTNESMYPIMKMIYLADKLHLERHGRFIAGDHYAAMEQGPVPSCTYNMIKHVRGDDCLRDGDEVARRFLRYGDNHSIHVIEKPDYDELSDSDQRALDDVISIYRMSNKWTIRDLSHDPAWKRAWKGRMFRKSVSLPIEKIAGQLNDSEALLAHLKDPTPGEARPPQSRTGDGHRGANN